MDRDEYCQKTNTYIIDFIKFGDAKAGSILTLSGLIAGGIGSQAEVIIFQSYKLCPLAGWISGCLVLMILYYMLKVVTASLRALKPRTPTTEVTSLNSYPDIAKMSQNDFRDAIKGLENKSFSDNFASHNWTLSKITLDKFVDIGDAVVNLKYVIFSATAFLVFSLAIKIITKFSENY